MRYRKLGNTGLDVSVIGLGANNFGGRLDFDQTKIVLDQVIGEGINLIDTSNSYGNTLSEEYFRNKYPHLLVSSLFLLPSNIGLSISLLNEKYFLS